MAPARTKKAAPKKAAGPRNETSPEKVAASSKKPVPERKAAPLEVKTVSWWEDFYRVIRKIPSGRVTTYGAVALFGGHPRSARHVGYALAAVKEGKHADVPWQRVLGAATRGKAKVAIKDPLGGAIQRKLLEREGVTFDALGRVSLESFGWSGPRARKKPIEG